MLNLRQGSINQPIINVDAVVTVSGNGHTTSPLSGDPVLVGNIPGVALNDKDSVTGWTPVNTSCIAALSVVGKTTGGGNGAISVGDLLYMQTDGTIDKNTTGTGAVKFGTAFGNDESASVVGTDTRSGVVVSSGATTTIRVWVGKVN